MLWGSAPVLGQGWMDGRVVAWSVALVQVVINWVSGNPSVAIDSGPLGQASANIWGVKGVERRCWTPSQISRRINTYRTDSVQTKI